MVGHGIVAVAFVGKLNEPLYFYSEEDTAEALNLQMIIYGALDVVEEKIKKYVFHYRAPNMLYKASYN